MPVDRSVGNYYDSSASFLRRVARWQGPNPYVAGGEPVTPGAFGLGKIIALILTPATNGVTYVTPLYNPGTGKIMFFASAGGAEISGGVDLSTYVGGMEVIGT